MGKFKTGGYKYCRNIDDAISSKKPILTDDGFGEIVIRCTRSSNTVTLPDGVKDKDIIALLNKGVDVSILIEGIDITKFHFAYCKQTNFTIKFVSAIGADVETLTFNSENATTGTVTKATIS